MESWNRGIGAVLFTSALLVTVDPSYAQTGTTAGVDSTITAPATTPPATEVPPPPPPPASSKPPLRERIYYGGSVIFSFGGDVSRMGIYPMIAYKVRPKWSVGLELGYERVKYDDFNQSADNYGWSVFTRYRLIPQIYAHAEYQMVDYEIFTGPAASERELVSFLLLGGGLSQKIGPRTWAYAEVLFDVLQSDKSPYDDWEPVISVGVGVGF
jgi:hypothetical protein